MPSSWYARTPLYIKILIGLVLGVIAGLLLPGGKAKFLNIPAQMILRFLGAIAPPLILLAVMRAIMTANVRGRLAGKMFYLLALNTTVAILVGLLVANVLRPGKHAALPTHEAVHLAGDPVEQLLSNIPASLVAPLVENNVIGVIIIAVAFALAARRLDRARQDKLLAALDIGFDLILIVLHWII